MARKDVVQNQLDVLNNALSSVIIGGLIGISIIYAQYPDMNNLLLYAVIFALGIVGYVINRERNGFLKELNTIK